MKKIEKIFLLTIILTSIVNIWIYDNEITKTLFCIICFTFSITYLFFGYFIFKSQAELIKNKFLSISNGISISFCLFILIGKFTFPTISSSIVIVIIPLFLITSYLFYKAYNKNTRFEESKFFKYAFTKNFIYVIILILLMIIPAKIFSRYIYGYNSEMYYETLQNIYLDDATSLRKNGNNEMALTDINKSLKYSELALDKSSVLYQKCLNECGHIYYEKSEYKKADSILNLVLERYIFEDPKDLVKSYDEDYQNEYFVAIYLKAQVNSSWGNYNKSDSLFKITLDYYSDNLKLAYIYSTMAHNKNGNGELGTADSLFNLSLNYHRKTEIVDTYNYLWTLTESAENKIDDSKFNAADSILSLCYTFAKTKFKLNSKEVANVLDVYVLLNITTAKFSEAEKYCLESIKIKGESLGIQHIDYINSNLDLVSIFIAKSMYKEADKLLKKTKISIESNFDNRSPIAFKLYDILTQYNLDYMNYDEAQLFAEKSLDGRVYWYGKYNINTAISYHNLASVYYYQQKYNYSDSLYNLSIKIRKYYTGVKSQDYLSSLNGLGLIFIKKDSLKLADDYLNYCLLTFEKKIGNEHPAYATILSNLASLNIKQKKYSDANEKLIKALAIYEKVFNEKHIKIAKTFYEFGVLELQRTNTTQAINYFTKANIIYQDVLGNKHYFVNHIRNEIVRLKKNKFDYI